MRLQVTISFLLCSLVTNCQKPLDNLVNNINQFGFDYLKTIPADQNVFFSPASIYITLGMLQAGANGLTAEAIKQIVQYEGAERNNSNIHQLLGTLIQLLNNRSIIDTLETSNLFVYRQGYSFRSDFEENLKSNYKTLEKEMDFERERAGSIEDINNWAREKTQQKVTKFLEEIPTDIMTILLNSISFEEKWKYPFDSFVSRISFYNIENEEKRIPVMFLRGQLNYAQIFKYGLDTVDLPFKDGHTSMLILLPSISFGPDLTLDEIEKTMDVESINYILKKMDIWGEREVRVSFAKFKLEDSRKLKINLTALGLDSLFSKDAEFSSMGEENVFVSEILHQSKFEVDTTGSQAAAVTGALLDKQSSFVANSSSSIDKRGFCFYTSKPFLFVIRDRRTNLILFVGRVTHV